MNYLLLQINDALFPIGGYSHSYGLETYIQKGIVRDSKTARTYIHSMLLHNFCQNELLAAKMAYEFAESDRNGALEQLAGLDERITATRVAAEVRQAGEKLGSRFIKTVSGWDLPFKNKIFEEYKAIPGPKNHPVVYGVFCAGTGIEKTKMLEHYLYAQTSAAVTNCVKTVPLSQTDGQQILFDAHDLFDKVMERLEKLGEEDLGAEAPGFEIRCMQHETLYSRLYMS